MHLQGKTYWGRFAGFYDRGTDFVVGRDLRETLADQLRREEPLGEVLECGCGVGPDTEVLLALGARVIAVDLSGLDIARDNLGLCDNLCMVQADITDLPLKKMAFSPWQIITRNYY